MSEKATPAAPTGRFVHCRVGSNSGTSETELCASRVLAKGGGNMGPGVPATAPIRLVRRDVILTGNEISNSLHIANKNA